MGSSSPELSASDNFDSAGLELIALAKVLESSSTATNLSALPLPPLSFLSLNNVSSEAISEPRGAGLARSPGKVIAW